VKQLFYLFLIVGILTWLLPSPAGAVKLRLGGFGEGDHPGLMVYTPLKLGIVEPAFGFQATAKDEFGAFKYVPAWDMSLFRLDENDSGYFVRFGTDFQDWNPNLGLGITLGFDSWISAEAYYQWSYMKIPSELEYEEGFVGGVGIGLSADF